MPVHPILGRLAKSFVLGIALSLLLSALPAYAADSFDEPISGGHFFKQANGFGGKGDRGFSIWDGPNGIAFYSKFRELGGVNVLGYPASRLFERDGFIYLVTQGALLQYHPGLEQVFLGNTFEILESADLDDLLYARGIPTPITDDGSGGDFQKAKETRLGWLTNDAIRERYFSAGGEDAAIKLYGLPMSKPQAFGPFITQRFQRITLQYWTENVPGMADKGDVKVILGGDLLKEFDLLPFEAKLPHMRYERPAPIVVDGMREESAFKHVIGEGTSVFTGSANHRVHNIALAASKLHGHVIEPGETFSFLEALGPINYGAGYRSSLVIFGDRTIWGIGGGVCQVSTTMFRAAFWAGLPIVERNQHSYRVSYYEKDGSPPGFDAAIFNPGLDLKFVNDSEDPILIQTHVDEHAMGLTITLRGRELNRTVEMLPAVAENVVAPGPPLPDRPDPTLAYGVRLQVEWAAEGVKTVIRRQVSQDGTVRVDEFSSEFAPWRERWVVGTARSTAASESFKASPEAAASNVR